MHTLQPSTLATQKGSSYTPVVQVTIGTATFLSTDPSSGLTLVETVEEGQSYRGTIEIRPSVLSAVHPGILQLAEGERVSIKWGFEGEEVIESPPLFVVTVSGRSEPGDVLARFDCIGWWELLAVSRVVRDPSQSDAPPPVWPGDTTVRSILNEILVGRGNVFVDSDDGIINSYRPYYEADGLESVLTTVRNLLDMTQSYIKLMSDGFHIVHPSTSSPVDYTYELDGHDFFTRSHASKITIPNRIVMLPELPTVDTAPDFIGVSVDQPSVDKLGFLDMISVDEGIISQGEANSRADAVLKKLQAEGSEGIAVVPMNIGQELYDHVRIYDTRIQAVPFENFVGMIRRTWTSGVYAMELGLGGLMAHLSGLRTVFPTEPIRAPIQSPIPGLPTVLPPRPAIPVTIEPVGGGPPGREPFR